MITISIVSHGHGGLLPNLIAQLAACPGVGTTIVTRNIPEPLNLHQVPNLMIRDNEFPRGFGANHNAAFRQCSTPFFCVMNPDIEISADPFPALLKCMETESAALVAPLVLSPAGEVEDSIRHFPTPIGLVRKVLGGPDGRYQTVIGAAPFAPDWVAGMFMLFRAQEFAEIGGFDEGFFLYYEDVDVCARLWASGRRIIACPSASVVHDARRESHRVARYAGWHARSMVRYFWKHAWRSPRSLPAR